MKIQKFLDLFPDAFFDATEDLNWIEISKAIDNDDGVLLLKLMRNVLEPKAESMPENNAIEIEIYNKVLP